MLEGEKAETVAIIVIDVTKIWIGQIVVELGDRFRYMQIRYPFLCGHKSSGHVRGKMEQRGTNLIL